MPDVSVVLWGANGERFLAETLASIALSGVAPERVELVAVDGGSVDRSLEIIGEVAGTFGAQQQLAARGGPAPLLNAGLAAATGDRIAFLRYPDAVHPGVWADALEQDADLVAYDTLDVDGFTRTLLRVPLTSGDPLPARDALLRGRQSELTDALHPGAVVVARRAVEYGRVAFPERLGTGVLQAWAWGVATSPLTLLARPRVGVLRRPKRSAPKSADAATWLRVVERAAEDGSLSPAVLQRVSDVMLPRLAKDLSIPPDRTAVAPLVQALRALPRRVALRTLEAEAGALRQVLSHLMGA